MSSRKEKNTFKQNKLRILNFLLITFKIYSYRRYIIYKYDRYQI